MPGTALGIRYRIDGTRRKVHVRVDVLPVGSKQPAARIGLGWKRILSTVRSYADVEPTLSGRIEELIDFVTVDQG